MNSGGGKRRTGDRVEYGFPDYIEVVDDKHDAKGKKRLFHNHNERTSVQFKGISLLGYSDENGHAVTLKNVGTSNVIRITSFEYSGRFYRYVHDEKTDGRSSYWFMREAKV